MIAHEGRSLGSSAEVILAERLFYEVDDGSTWREQQRDARKRFLRDSTHLQVEAHVDRVLDLTDASTIKMALLQTHEIIGDLDSLHHLVFFEMILSADRGGCDITDVLGYWAWDRGYAGILFPSVRILTEYGNPDAPRRDFRHPSLQKIARTPKAADMVGEVDRIQLQLAEDWNLVRADTLSLSVTDTPT